MRYCKIAGHEIGVYSQVCYQQNFVGFYRILTLKFRSTLNSEQYTCISGLVFMTDCSKYLNVCVRVWQVCGYSVGLWHGVS